MIWPSSASATLNRSSGRGAGPSKLMPGDVKAAAVARALEFLLGRQPVGRAAQVRADRLQRVEDILPVVLGRSDDPETPLGLEPLVDVFGLVIARGGRS